MPPDSARPKPFALSCGVLLIAALLAGCTGDFDGPNDPIENDRQVVQHTEWEAAGDLFLYFSARLETDTECLLDIQLAGRTNGLVQDYIGFGDWTSILGVNGGHVVSAEAAGQGTSESVERASSASGELEVAYASALRNLPVTGPGDFSVHVAAFSLENVTRTLDLEPPHPAFAFAFRCDGNFDVLNLDVDRHPIAFSDWYGLQEGTALNAGLGVRASVVDQGEIAVDSEAPLHLVAGLDPLSPIHPIKGDLTLSNEEEVRTWDMSTESKITHIASAGAHSITLDWVHVGPNTSFYGIIASPQAVGSLQEVFE